MRILKKNYLISIIIFIFLFFTIKIKLWLFIFLMVMYFLLMFILFLNKLVKHTNWWKNIYIYTSQFVSNYGYRKDLNRNYEVVNLGSNPARFGFFYESILGENWSTGTQGFDFDFEIFKYYHSYLREGAYVLLPIVQFSSISGYLINRPHSARFYSKFCKILDGFQISNSLNLKKGKLFLRFPLLFEPYSIKYLIHDELVNKDLEKYTNDLQYHQFINDAHEWMNIWKKEFNIKNFYEPLSHELEEGWKKSVEMMLNLISFIRERNYKPVIVSLPMSKELGELFNKQLREKYVYSFVNEIQSKIQVDYLDYMDNEELSEDKYFFNSLYMNLDGRKKFTKIILKDLGIIK